MSTRLSVRFDIRMNRPVKGIDQVAKSRVCEVRGILSGSKATLFILIAQRRSGGCTMN